MLLYGFVSGTSREYRMEVILRDRFKGAGASFPSFYRTGAFFPLFRHGNTSTMLRVQESFSDSFFFLPSDSFSTSASVRYSTAGSTSVIITTEQMVPIPSSSPTVEMEF